MFKTISPRLLLSGAVITAAAAFIIGATYAIFSDTETSTGNVLAAGELDLKIDNTSYYNGVLNQDTTWTLNDLTNQLFFDFTDVKPSDLGEDTISLHAENDAWVCADFTLTENNDNTCTTNEQADDPTCNDPDADDFDGELAQNIEFAFWADDGDNVLETGEEIVSSGSAQSVLNNPITIADSLTNNIGGVDGTPMTGGVTHYIAKAWCFGDLATAPLAQDGQGPESPRTPANSTGGVTCDGSLLNEATQSDRVMADVTFYAEQSRNNPNFTCSGEVTPTPTPTITPTPEPGEPFGDAVTAVAGTFGHCCDAGDLSSSTAVAAASVTGAPDSPPDADFIQISDSSSVTVQFNNNKAVAGSGADIRIHVYDLLFPADASIEVSDDPTCTGGFVSAGTYSDSANIDIDINGLGLTEAFCVRINDLVASPDNLFPTLGFDLDAIEALNSQIYP